MLRFENVIDKQAVFDLCYACIDHYVSCLIKQVRGRKKCVTAKWKVLENDSISDTSSAILNNRVLVKFTPDFTLNVAMPARTESRK